MKVCVSLLLPVLILAGCSSFNTDYQRAAEVAQGQPLVGAWDGYWQSNQGHGSGRLQCVVTGLGTAGTEPGTPAGVPSERVYTARFKATFGQVLHAEYTASIQATPDLRQLSTLKLHTTYDIAGSSYTMDGQATPAVFTAKYKSDDDEGTIEMRRPARK